MKSFKRKNPVKNKTRSPLGLYLAFSSIFLKMIVAVGLGVWAGVSLDRFFEVDRRFFSVGCALIGVVVAIYIAYHSSKKLLG